MLSAELAELDGELDGGLNRGDDGKDGTAGVADISLQPTATCL